MAHNGGTWKAGLIAVIAASGVLFHLTAGAATRYAAGVGAGTGNWNATATWNSSGCGNATNNPSVPAAADDVIICPSRTVFVSANQSALTITVNSSGILRLGTSTTARTLTVSGNITINAGGTFDANPAFAATHVLAHTGAGNIINDGTINFANTGGGNNALCNVTFAGWTGIRTVSGVGTSGFNRITINGNSNTINDIVDFTAANFSMAAIGGTGLTLTDGTFRLSTPATIAPFGAAAFTLATNDRFWLNHSGATVNAGSGTFTVNTGELRIDSGIFNATGNVATAMNVTSGALLVNGGTLNVGSGLNNTLLLTSNAASTIQMTGGTVNVAGRLASSATGGAGVFNLSGGVITAGTVGNTTNNALNAPFFIGSAVSYTQSGGAIVIENANAANNAREYDNRATTASITGGTLQIGDAGTAAGQTFQINSVPPVWNLDIVNNSNPSDPVALLIANLTINNDLTIGNGTTLSAGNNNITILGNWINNGATNSYIVNNGTVTFAGTAAQSLKGSATETTINRLIMNNSATAANSKLTLEHDLRVTNLLTMTSGRIASLGLNTSPATPKAIIPSGASISGAGSSSFVSGRLQMNIPNGNNKTVDFPIGTEGAVAPALAYTPASFLFSGVGGSGGELVAYAVLGDHPQIATSTLDATKSVNRYWGLTDAGVSGAAADLTAATVDATFTFLNPQDLDAGANTANFGIERYSGGNWFSPGPGLRTSTTTQALLVNNVGEFAIAEKSAGGAVSGGFNAYDTATLPSTAVSGVINTKVSGNAISLDIVVLNAARTAINTTFSGSVQVELMNSANNAGYPDSNNCAPSWTLIQNLGNLTFSPADNGRKTITFTEPNAWREARMRMTYKPGQPGEAIGCSGDNFAIRPSSIAVAATDTTWSTAGTTRALTNTGASGGFVHKAGQPFTLTVTPSPGSATNYDGAPAVSALACTLPAVCATGTLTVGAFSGSGTRTSNAATYSEAGAFDLTLVDQSFASVDASDGTPADCSAAGRYVCQSPAPVAVGRFVPDRFEFASPGTPILLTFNNALCGTRAFTYVGQPFWYAAGGRPSATVNAVNLAGAVTSNYTFATGLSKPAISEVYADSTAPPAAPLDTTLIGTPSLSGSGTGTYMGALSGLLFYTRNTPVVPFTAAISLTVTASDSTESVVGGNGTINTTTPLVFSSIAFDSGAEFRFGRLRLGSASGSQLLALNMQMQTQYWGSTGAGSSFITNVADSCTVLAPANLALGNYQRNLNACETSVTVGSFAAGRSTVRLSAPGAGNNGSVDVTANLGAAGSGTTCIAGVATPVTGANRAYLQGNWSGAAYDQNPSARATFGVSAGSVETIYTRENY